MNEEEWKTIYDVQVYVTFVLILWKNTDYHRMQYR